MENKLKTTSVAYSSRTGSDYIQHYGKGVQVGHADTFSPTVTDNNRLNRTTEASQ
jgi:hypothetical protein